MNPNAACTMDEKRNVLPKMGQQTWKMNRYVINGKKTLVG
jgi:hypothetical protein